VDFAFTDEQEMLRAAARDYLADRYPPERVAALADAEPGWDPGSWPEVAGLGWLDRDLGVLEHAVLLEESGRALYPGPLFSTLALAAAGLPDDLADAVAAGERSVTVAVAEAGGPLTLADALTAGETGTRADRQARLSGRKVLVPDAGLVTDVLVVAAGPEGLGLYAVELPAGTVTVRATLDSTRRLGEIPLAGTPARLVGDAAAVAALRMRALAGTACEAIGVAARAFELAAGYARTREQFGRLIGSYQAVSHRVADIFIELELARSLAYWAAWAVAEGDEQAPLAAAAAKASAGAAAVAACEGAIQVHGGVGFTWEHPLHRYYKRAQWLASYEGAGAVHRAQLADLVLG
jgi:alkylation response protein AidB-like acyl-CoA dehydrogenase